MNRTTFGESNGGSGQWYWTTRSENGKIIADGGGYNSKDSAVNGYISSQGFPDWRPGDTLPEGYSFNGPLVILQDTN